MKNYILKVRYILIPYLGVLAMLGVSYTFWNWLLFIKFDLFRPDQGITNIIIPGILAVLLTFSFFSTNINRLYYKNDKGRDMMYIILVLALSIPLIITQEYLSTATGTMTHLRTISEIDKLPETKYYTLDDSYLLKKDLSAEQRAETSGKNNQYLHFYIYSVVPILERDQDTLVHMTRYWMCKRYEERISNYRSETEKETAFREFSKRSEQEFYKERYRFTYLERLKKSSDVDYYVKATNKNKWTGEGEPILLIQKQGKYEDRNGNKLGWIFTATAIAIAVLMLLLLCFRLKSEKEWQTYQKKIAREKKKGWRKNYEYLIPQDDFYITPLLAYANILVFLLLVFSGAGFMHFDGEILISKGSISTPYITLGGEYWRFLTYMFLHGGIMHLANNLLSLFFVSIVLEPILGRWKFLSVYILCGLAAGITTYLWHDEINSVGASGAIFGLYGFMFAISVLKVTREPINKAFLMIGLGSLVLTLFMGMFGNIDNAAHIGGLLSGLLLGVVAAPFLKQKE
jgi:rhomboid protease GluP